MCQACNEARFKWYEACRAKSPYAEQLKALYQAQRNLCREYQQQRAWAAACPPNPELSERELEATR